MNNTTSSTQAGARANSALLPTLGLGGGPRAGNGSNESGGAFSDLLRDKIAAPTPEAPKAASPAPAPAAKTAQSQPAAQARKAEANQGGKAQAAEASAEGDAEVDLEPDADSAETQLDPRSRRPSKTLVGQTLKPGSEAAQAQKTPGEPLTVTCAADEALTDPTTEATDELPVEAAEASDASVAQAILQMLNAPVAAPVKAGTGGADAAGQKQDASAQGLPANPLTLPTDTQAAGPSATAATQGKDAAAAAAAAQLQLGDGNDKQALAAGEARFSRTAEALATPASQSTAGSPGSFAAHLQSLSNPRSAQANGSSAPAPVALAQPLHSPEFAPAMSARLAMLAAEGVQQAQLQLNPAEMGPVSVQITVEGQQAQIAFHAVQADTRQVLEQSLPELAAALRDQGLTLSGGGVFEQSQQQAREQAQRGLSGSNLAGQGGQDGLPSDAELLAAQAASRTPPPRSRGVVDLYA